MEIVGRFPQDLAADVAGDLSLKALFCHFLISSALVALARAEDCREQQLSHYRLMRDHVAAYENVLQPLQGSLDEKSSQDLLDKLAVLFVFDFEGAASLGNWDALGETVRKASACKSVSTYQAMGDCLLRSNAPHECKSSEMISAW